MEQQKQKRILQAAQDLFGRHGFKRVAIDEIAKKAGVSKGTVYNFAESKDELYFRVAEEELAQWVAEAESRLDFTKPADELLLSAGLYSFEYLDNRPMLRQFLVEDLDYSMEVWVKKLDHIRRKCSANSAKILEHGIRQGSFRADLDVDNTALVLQDILIHALILKYRRGVSEALVWASTALDLMLRGLKSP
jgi:AcrR family transcriptional regulator